MLSARSIAVSYLSGRVLAKPLVDVDIDIKPGETVALMGPSGSGKSTLLRVLSGSQKPDSGTVSIHGKPLRPRSGVIDPRTVLVHQDYRLVDFLTARENVRLALEVRNIPYRKSKVTEVLEAVGLGDKLDNTPDELSGGEKQRVALARAMVVGASVVLADEPTGALDRDNSNSVAALLRTLAASGDVCVLVATHDHEVADSLDRTVFLAGGRATEIDT